MIDPVNSTNMISCNKHPISPKLNLRSSSMKGIPSIGNVTTSELLLRSRRKNELDLKFKQMLCFKNKNYSDIVK